MGKKDEKAPLCRDFSQLELSRPRKREIRPRDWAFPENVWAKMQTTQKQQIGVSITDKGVTAWQKLPNITVHYWENLQTGARMGFKFVSPP